MANALKKQTFMQKYREWQRSGSRLKASIDKDCIEDYGYPTVRFLDQYDRIHHSYTHFNLHTHINFRERAMRHLGSDWDKQKTELNKRWYHWVESTMTPKRKLPR